MNPTNKAASAPEVGAIVKSAAAGAEPTFRSKCEEAGTDMDAFVNLLGRHKNNLEIASELGLPVETVSRLKGHYYTH